MKKIILIIAVLFTLLFTQKVTASNITSGRFAAMDEYRDLIKTEANLCFISIDYRVGSKSDYDLVFKYETDGCTTRVARIGKSDNGETVIIDTGKNGDPVYFVYRSAISGNGQNEDIGAHDGEMSDLPTYQNNNSDEVESEKVLRITDTSYDKATKKYTIVSEDNENRKKYPAYEVCTSDFFYTPSGKVAGCRRPFMIIVNKNGKTTGKKHDTCGSDMPGGMYGTPAPELCAERMRKQGYIIKLDDQDFRAGRLNAIEDAIYLFSGDSNVSAGSKFIICNPSGNFVFDNSGHLTDCDNFHDVTFDNRSNKLPILKANVTFFFDFNEDVFLLLPR